MVNFILYEDSKEFRKMYSEIIFKVLGEANDAYRIIEIPKYTDTTMSKLKNIIGKKIYIMDIEVPGKSGLDLARDIRATGDWNSQLIIVTSHDKMISWNFHKRMLMLDLISKFYDCEENLRESIKLAYEIQTSDDAFKFQQGGELYRIPYQDIMYIEKSPDSYYATIVTREEEIELAQDLSTIMSQLGKDPRFFRSHRSCIVNIFNIKSVELANGVIKFENKETNLLSRSKKRELKEKMRGTKLNV